MKKIKILFALSLMATFVLGACEQSNTSGTTDDISGTDTTSASGSDSESGDIVGTPILPGEVPNFVDIYFSFMGENLGNYQLWLWDDGGTDGVALDWDLIEGDWAVRRIDTAAFAPVHGLGIIIRSRNSWSFQTADGFIRFSDFGQVDGVLSVYTIIGDGNILEYYSRASDALGDRIISADFLDFDRVELVSTAEPTSIILYIDGVETQNFVPSQTTQILTLSNKAVLTKKYEIYTTYATHQKIKIKPVSPRAIYKSQAFSDAYTYTGDDLGATYTPQQTMFKLWAPTSSAVRLHLFNYGSPSTLTGDVLSDVPTAKHDMILGEKGVWSVTVQGDLNLKFYTYRVTNSNGVSEIVDPYAKSVGANGLRGQVINFENYETATFDSSINQLSPIDSPTDLVVYEMHVADLTWDETWNGSEENRGKYLGLIEEGTTYTEGETTVATGFDHIKELGVNAVQIMPFYDQSNFEYPRQELIVDEDGEPILDNEGNNQYNEIIPSHNWGYNPLNFNALEGVYASNPYRGEYRIQEFKQVVETFAEHDIRVIMDVVYNHVASASASNFNKVVPGYYFRYNSDWTLNNDSGVGNVFASENPMAAKFLIDSILFWIDEYNIKGFRFDLMQLINDDTLIALDQALKDAGHDDVTIWGEPWSAKFGDYSGGDKVNRGVLKDTRIGAFNDQGRNALKGGNNITNNEHWGWVNKGVADNYEQPYINRVKGLLAGIHGNYYEDNGQFDSKYNNNPSKAVNYAGSHDNFSLFDQMLFSFGGNEELAMRAQTTANAIVLSGQGIPFFQGGDEIGRSKPFDETSEIASEFIATHGGEYAILNGQYYSGNSYNIGYETNSYKWDDKIKWLDFFNTYKELIALRLGEKGDFLHLKSASEVGDNFRYWQDMNPPLGWSSIASENKFNSTGYQSSGAIYSFYTARISESDTVTEVFRWSNTGVQARVIYDSEGLLTGQTLTNQVAMGRFRVIIVERL